MSTYVAAEGFFDEAKLAASLLDPDEASREKTLGGSLIASARDLVSAKPTNEIEASARAASNDMFAELAVDTFALMPRVSWAKAGGARVAFLINPKADIVENTLFGAANFAEGVALNRVGKMGAKFMHGTPALSQTLTSESVGLFKFGFGMGAVKATFDEHTWLDKDKKFQGPDALLSILKAGTVGGAIGVPAGLVGSRVARFGMHHLADSGLHPRALSVGLGMTSGYPAGAVFGGVDTVLHGGTFADFVKASHEGGLVGMATGGLSGLALPHEIAIANRKQALFGDEHQPVVFEAQPAGSGAMESRVVIRYAAAPSMEGIPAEHYARLGMEVRHDLEANLARLGAPVPGTIKRVTASADAASKAKSISEAAKSVSGTRDPDAGFDKFAEAALVTKEEPALVYKLFNIDVALPVDYARDLNRTYGLRIVRDKGMKPGATTVERAAAEQAALILKDDPLQFMAHPADLLAVAQVPDKSLFKRIEVYPWANADDFWIQATYKRDFVTGATAATDGTLAYYQPRLDSNLTHLTHHEWGHFLKYRATRESALYEFASVLERKSHLNRKEPGYATSEYARRNIDECWAEHCSDVTQPDPAGFFAMAVEAPLKLVVIGRANDRALKSVSRSSRSPDHELLVERMGEIENYVLPGARELMTHYVMRGTPQERIAAAHLLAEFGTPEQLNLLKAVAKRDGSPEVRDAAFKLAGDVALTAREPVTGYVQYGRDRPRLAYEDFLIEMSGTDSRCRSLALNELRNEPGARAQGYHALFGPAETPHLRVRSLLEAMVKIPDLAGKQAAFEQAVTLEKRSPDRAFELGIEVMNQVPELRGPAVELLMRTNLAKAEPIMKDLVEKAVHPLDELAQVGLARLKAERRLAHLTNQLDGPNAILREQAIRDLGSTRDYGAIRPLLLRLRSGTPAEIALARQALAENFNNQIIKEEMRKLGQMDPKWKAVVQPVLERKFVPRDAI